MVLTPAFVESSTGMPGIEKMRFVSSTAVFILSRISETKVRASPLAMDWS
jgi:hypothetical protein